MVSLGLYGRRSWPHVLVLGRGRGDDASRGKSFGKTIELLLEVGKVIGVAFISGWIRRWRADGGWR